MVNEELEELVRITADQTRDAQICLQEMYRDKSFTDFEIIAGGQTFATHRAVLARHTYFGAMFKHDFVEGSTSQMTLPEASNLVGAMLRYIYGFPINELILVDGKEGVFAMVTDFGRMSLYAIADKYQLLNLKRWSYFVWKQKFKNFSFEGIGDYGYLFNVFRDLSYSEGNTDVFKQDIIDSFFKYLRAGIAHMVIQELYQVNGTLTKELLRQYILRSRDGEYPDGPWQAGGWQRTDSVWRVYGGQFDSKCPSCSKSWRWDRTESGSKLECPFCQALHPWIEYVIAGALTPVVDRETLPSLPA